MNDTTRTIEPGQIYKEISQDDQIVRRRIKEAGAGPEVREAISRSAKTGKIECVHKTFVKGSRLTTSMSSSSRQDGRANLFTLTGKKSQAFRMKGVLKAFSEKFGAMK